jgi:hypothetical protein
MRGSMRFSITEDTDEDGLHGEVWEHHPSESRIDTDDTDFTGSLCASYSPVREVFRGLGASV